MAETKLIFLPERETKRTIRYQEARGHQGGPVIGTLYVQKHAIEALGLSPTDRLTVTLSKG